MKSIKNLVEYYDELFPVTEEQKSFYKALVQKYHSPVHFLRYGCGTGIFESNLAKEGHDVTAVENEQDLLKCANLRRRNQLMSIRFFQMTYQDMGKYLAKNFYNIISVLNSRIIFFPDRETILDFLQTCRTILSQDGTIVLQLMNFEKYGDQKLIQLPTRESVRSRLFTEILSDQEGRCIMSCNIENSSEKILPVMNDVKVYPLVPDEIESLAEEAGFSTVEFYSGFDKSEFTGSEDSYVVMLS